MVVSHCCQVPAAAARVQPGAVPAPGGERGARHAAVIGPLQGITLVSHLLPGTGCSSARAARGCSCAWRRARCSTCRCHWPSSRHDSRVALAARYRLQQRSCGQGLSLRLEASAVLDVPLSLALSRHNPRVAPAARYRLQQRACSQAVPAPGGERGARHAAVIGPLQGMTLGSHLLQVPLRSGRDQGCS